MDTTCLLYYIIDERQVDMAKIIDNEMKMITSSSHHLGNKTPSKLDFPDLIIGLCQKARVTLLSVVSETIDGEVNDRYIERHCVPRQSRVRNAQAHPTQQQVFDERAACSYTWDMLEANQGTFLPFQPEEAIGVEVETIGESVEEESEKGESMND
ncbi:hypothetical protein KIW84_045937 [Lathyrus oleraceus]|uniref:Uncharacterized protein n=1 Tax=Pisum sativum TaxID=3888 RepID=A0A9D5AXW0_PEA|nr:hypothetical protein KIW84_045937 [Pisum sativum]